MAIRETLTGEYAEGATSVLSGTIEDETGVGFKPTTVYMTLYNRETGAIINSRDRTDITADVSVGGVIARVLTAADNVIAAPRAGKTTETHVALIEWDWTSGVARSGKFEIVFTVSDLEQA